MLKRTRMSHRRLGTYANAEPHSSRRPKSVIRKHFLMFCMVGFSKSLLYCLWISHSRDSFLEYQIEQASFSTQ